MRHRVHAKHMLPALVALSKKSDALRVWCLLMGATSVLSSFTRGRSTRRPSHRNMTQKAAATLNASETP
jgi:hypothetical protein